MSARQGEAVVRPDSSEWPSLTHPVIQATILLSCTKAALIPNNRHLIQLKRLRFSLRVPQPHEYPIAINYRPDKQELDPREA
jgi:hypothetical protein